MAAISKTVTFTSQELSYGALVALNVLLVWILPYFPTQDGPSHIYNLVILNDLLDGGRDWGAYFTHDIRAVPNLGFLAVSFPLIHLFTPFAVEKIFLSFYVLLMTTSIPVFLRAFGNRPFPLSFFVFPVLFNYTVMMGFYSYSIAVPCLILALAAAWRHRALSLPGKVLLYSFMGLILFFLHLIPFIIYLIFLSLMILTNNEENRTPLEKLFTLACVITPSLVLFSTYYFGKPQDSTLAYQQHMTPDNLLELAVQFLLFSVNSFSRWQILPWIVMFPIFYLLLRTRLREYLKLKSVPCGHKVIILLAACLTACYFILPNSFAGGSFFNERLPWVIFLISLPLLEIPQDSFLKRRGFVPFAATALFSLLVNGAIFLQQSSLVREFLTGLNADIAKGSIIAVYKPATGEWARADALLHADSYYGIEKKCVTAGNYEASMPYFPVRLKNETNNLPSLYVLENFPSQIDWEKYPSIHYLLAWKIDSNSRVKLGKQFDPVVNEEYFSLWKRK